MRKRTKMLIAAAVGVSVAALGGFVYMQLVKSGRIKHNKYDRRLEGSLRVGDRAPDLELTRYDGTAIISFPLDRTRDASRPASP